MAKEKEVTFKIVSYEEDCGDLGDNITRITKDFGVRTLPEKDFLELEKILRFIQRNSYLLKAPKFVLIREVKEETLEEILYKAKELMAKQEAEEQKKKRAAMKRAEARKIALLKKLQSELGEEVAKG